MHLTFEEYNIFAKFDSNSWNGVGGIGMASFDNRQLDNFFATDGA